MRPWACSLTMRQRISRKASPALCESFSSLTYLAPLLWHSLTVSTWAASLIARACRMHSWRACSSLARRSIVSRLRACFISKIAWSLQHRGRLLARSSSAAALIRADIAGSPPLSACALSCSCLRALRTSLLLPKRASLKRARSHRLQLRPWLPPACTPW